MATQTLGQLYCGDAFGRKWNRAWKSACDAAFSIVADITIDRIPQDLFGQLLATAFWCAADNLGGVPKCVTTICTVPERPTKSWSELTRDLATWLANLT